MKYWQGIPNPKNIDYDTWKLRGSDEEEEIEEEDEIEEEEEEDDD